MRFSAPLPSLFVAASLVFASIPIARAVSPGAFYLHDGDRVVFYGDSITDQRLYTTFVETFVLTRFPGLKVSFVHSGWGGDRVTGGGGGPIERRLERDVFAYDPTVMTIMLGMNDASYRAFDEAIFKTYADGYLSILDHVAAKFPKLRFTLIEPSPYDDITRPVTFPGGYNATLLHYAEFVRKTASDRKLADADFNGAVNAMLAKANATDPGLAQKILPDRIHPGPAGHLIMAGALLKAWNAPAVVSEVAIDAGNRKVTTAKETTLSDLKFAPTLSWTEQDLRLPFPVDFGDPAVALAMKSSDFIETLNRETLKISGLPAKAYELTIDGSYIGTFPAEQFASGLNLALLRTPMSKQAEQVAALTRERGDKHNFRWRDVQVPLENDHDPEMKKALPAVLRAFDRQEAEIAVRQRQAAQPVPHHYELTPARIWKTPNFALGKPFTASNPNLSGWDRGLTNGVRDGQAGDVWASGVEDSFPKSVTVDLTSAVPLEAVIVSVPPYGSTKTVEVSLSRDDKSFASVGQFVFPPGVAGRHTYEFPVASARYIRLTYPDHHSTEFGYPSTYVFTSEVEAYGPDKP